MSPEWGHKGQEWAGGRESGQEVGMAAEKEKGCECKSLKTVVYFSSGICLRLKQHLMK